MKPSLNWHQMQTLWQTEQHDQPSEQGPIEPASEKIKCFKRKADSDDSDDDGEIMWTVHLEGACYC